MPCSAQKELLKQKQKTVYEENYRLTFFNAKFPKHFMIYFKPFLVCPEDMPFVYTYLDDNDSCCSKEISESGSCLETFDYCDHDPPCESHPSVITENDNNEEVENDDGKGERF